MDYRHFQTAQPDDPFNLDYFDFRGGGWQQKYGGEVGPCPGASCPLLCLPRQQVERVDIQFSFCHLLNKDLVKLHFPRNLPKIGQERFLNIDLQGRSWTATEAKVFFSLFRHCFFNLFFSLFTF